MAGATNPYFNFRNCRHPLARVVCDVDSGAVSSLDGGEGVDPPPHLPPPWVRVDRGGWLLLGVVGRRFPPSPKRPPTDPN